MEAEKQARLSTLLDEEEEENEEDGIENSPNLNNSATNKEENINDSNKNENIMYNATQNTNTETKTNDKTDNKNMNEMPLKSTIKTPWRATNDSLLIGSCPHSWLFGRVGAVVHHGGAGNVVGVLVFYVFYICN